MCLDFFLPWALRLGGEGRGVDFAELESEDGEVTSGSGGSDSGVSDARTQDILELGDSSTVTLRLRFRFTVNARAE